MTWNGIYDLLFAQLRCVARPEGIWPFDPCKESHYESLRAWLVDDEMNHVYEIEEALDFWLEHQEWPMMTEPVARYIHLRLDQVCMFVMQFGDSPRMGKSPIPAPSAPLKSVLSWLLVDWWEVRGRSEAVQSWIVAKSENEL